MLLQTNSYVVPKDKRPEHARLVRRFRQTLARLGCDHFEVYEQVGQNWTNAEATGRFVQIMRFRDRQHQKAVQEAERTDPGAQALISEFCELINFPYQQQQGLFAVGFYSGVVDNPRDVQLLADDGGRPPDEGAIGLEDVDDEDDDAAMREVSNEDTVSDAAHDAEVDVDVEADPDEADVRPNIGGSPPDPRGGGNPARRANRR